MGSISFCLWLTGLPGSGKSTIGTELEKLLARQGVDTVLLTLDELRSFLTPQPKYSDEERELVYRALVLMAQFIVEQCPKAVIIDATGNRRHFRELARDRIRNFGEVYIRCPIEVCRAREEARSASLVEKNLYAKAEKGQLPGGLPGVTAPYEEPREPEVVVSSVALSPREAAEDIMHYVRSRWLRREKKGVNTMFPIKKILCPTDFSEPSLLAISAATELAGLTGAEILLVHVVSPLPASPHPGALSAFDTAAYLKEMLTHGRASMERLVKERIPGKVPSRSMILTGNPSGEIARVAEDEGVDLVVIATHGLTGWRRFVFGSVAERVVRTASCPVLTVPAPEKSEE